MYVFLPALSPEASTSLVFSPKSMDLICHNTHSLEQTKEGDGNGDGIGDGEAIGQGNEGDTAEGDGDGERYGDGNGDGGGEGEGDVDVTGRHTIFSLMVCPWNLFLRRLRLGFLVGLESLML